MAMIENKRTKGEKWRPISKKILANLNNIDSKGGRSEEYNSVEANLPLAKSDLLTIKTNF